MGGYAYKHANDMLRAWLSTVHWVNDKLTGENAINLKGCTKEEVNGFACKIMDYLKPMTSLKNFTALRNFRKAGCVPDKLDNLFNDCQRPTATETEEIHMVVGVPRRLCKNPSKHPELVTVAIGGDWSETPMSGWMSVEQMRRNLEISCVLFETLNPILRCLVEKIQGTGVTHIFVETANGAGHNVVHKPGYWNQCNWLRQYLHKTLGNNKLRLFVVDWEWHEWVSPSDDDGERHGLLPSKNNYCSPKFFTKTLLGLQEFFMIHD